MVDNAWLEKLATAVVANMLSNNEKDLTFRLEDVELKTPMFSEPIRLSGKLTIQLSTKKRAKK